MKVIMLLFLCLLSIVNSAKSQQTNYRVFPFDQLVTINGKQQSLEQYRGQHLIVELFTSTCIVCFKLLPKVNELQQQYKGRVQFFLLGNDNKTLPKTYARFQKKLGLTIDVGFDSVLFRQLNPPFAPRYLWVDTAGLIIAETGPDELTKTNIEHFFTGNFDSINDVQEKKQFSDKELIKFSVNNSDEGTIIYRSLFTGPIDSINAYFPRRLTFSKSGPFFQVINCRMEDLYKYAYFNSAYWSYGDSLYTKVYPEPLIEGEVNTTIYSKHSGVFCYSISFSEIRPVEFLQKVLRNDLENTFGFQAKVETRKMWYWALAKADTMNDQLRTKFDFPKEHFSYSGFNYQCIPISKVIRVLDYYCKSNMPFIDETGITYPIDISIEAMMTDLADVERGLKAVGLLLIKREKEMKVLVLRPLLENVAAK